MTMELISLLSIIISMLLVIVLGQKLMPVGRRQFE